MDPLNKDYYDYIRPSIIHLSIIVFLWDEKAISTHLHLSSNGRMCTSNTSSYSFKTSLGDIVFICDFISRLLPALSTTLK